MESKKEGGKEKELEEGKEGGSECKREKGGGSN